MRIPSHRVGPENTIIIYWLLGKQHPLIVHVITFRVIAPMSCRRIVHDLLQIISVIIVRRMEDALDPHFHNTMIMSASSFSYSYFNTS